MNPAIKAKYELPETVEISKQAYDALQAAAKKTTMPGIKKACAAVASSVVTDAVDIKIPLKDIDALMVAVDARDWNAAIAIAQNIREATQVRRAA